MTFLSSLKFFGPRTVITSENNWQSSAKPKQGSYFYTLRSKYGTSVLKYETANLHIYLI